MMTHDPTAQAAAPEPMPATHSSQPTASNPRKTPPAALAIQACLGSHYKGLTLERVAEDLTYAIETPGGRRVVLNRQVYALDALFNQLLVEVPRQLSNLPLLQLALKAQRQCQLTSAALSTHKKSDKRTDSSTDALSAFLNAKI